MARYLPPDLVAEIIVIANSSMPADWCPRWHYGPLAMKVRFVTADAIATLPVSSGWSTQQILKLLISRWITTPSYVILDAKTHLVFPLTADHIMRDGKLLSFRQSYVGHPAREFLDNALAYFHLTPDITCLPPASPPISVPTSAVRQMIEHIEEREGNFGEFFIRQRVMEFPLFAVYLIATEQLDQLYDFSGSNYPIIWDWRATHDDWIAQQIALSELHARPWFSLHRRAAPLLSDAGRQMISAFWQRRGLCFSH